MNSWPNWEGTALKEGKHGKGEGTGRHFLLGHPCGGLQIAKGKVFYKTPASLEGYQWTCFHQTYKKLVVQSVINPPCIRAMGFSVVPFFFLQRHYLSLHFDIIQIAITWAIRKQASNPQTDPQEILFLSGHYCILTRFRSSFTFITFSVTLIHNSSTFPYILHTPPMYIDGRN